MIVYKNRYIPIYVIIKNTYVCTYVYKYKIHNVIFTYKYTAQMRKNSTITNRASFIYHIFLAAEHLRQCHNATVSATATQVRVHSHGSAGGGAERVCEMQGRQQQSRMTATKSNRSFNSNGAWAFIYFILTIRLKTTKKSKTGNFHKSRIVLLNESNINSNKLFLYEYS